MPAGIPQVSVLPVAPAVAMAAPGNAITWPFHQKHWFGSLCMLAVGLLPLIGPTLLNLGWALEASAREAEHNPDRMPRARNIPSMWLHGVFYVLMTVCYFIIPGLIFTSIYSATVSKIGEEIFTWTVDYWLDRGIQLVNAWIWFLPWHFPLVAIEPYGQFFTRIVTTYLEAAIPPVLFFILSVALFLASMVRYAATRKLTSFFRPFKNLKLVMLHLSSFLWMSLLIFAMNMVFAYFNVIGLVLWATLGMWIYAHLIGRLAAKLRDAHAIG
jgi:hypothetical protein